MGHFTINGPSWGWSAETYLCCVGSVIVFMFHYQGNKLPSQSKDRLPFPWFGGQSEGTAGAIDSKAR